MYFTLYAVCTARQSTLALNCIYCTLSWTIYTCTQLYSWTIYTWAEQTTLEHRCPDNTLSCTKRQRKGKFLLGFSLWCGGCLWNLSFDAKRSGIALWLELGDGGKIDSWLLAGLNSSGFPRPEWGQWHTAVHCFSSKQQNRTRSNGNGNNWNKIDPITNVIFAKYYWPDQDSQAEMGTVAGTGQFQKEAEAETI